MSLGDHSFTYTAPPSDSPFCYKKASTNVFGTYENNRTHRFIAYATEMEGKFKGPIDNRQFLDEFFGNSAFSDGKVPRSPWRKVKSMFEKVPKAKNETDMYESLAKAISSCINLEQFQYAATHNKPDDGRPDGTLYEKSRYVNQADVSNSTFSDVVTEIKDIKDSPGFDDSDKEPFERRSFAAKLLRGQLIKYAVSQFANQYRTHLFMVFIRGKTARLIRWDRAGAIVSRAFKYDEEPYLAEFYSRYTNATPKARGIDTSVKQLSPNNPLVETVRQQLGLSSDDPVYEFQVWNDPPKLAPPVEEDEGEEDPEEVDPEEVDGYESGGEEKSEKVEEKEIPEEKQQVGLAYYGGKPLFSATQSVVGRATRIIKVWDPRRQAVVLLKDSWRVSSENILPEGEVYAILKANGVRHVPTCLRAGGVDSSSVTQRTLTPSKRTHIHYRLVLKEVCRGNITQFNDTKELIRVLCDGLIAHRDALRKCKLLHRDISAGNLLITTNGRGLLGDWELCKFVPHLGKPRQIERTGTWQFISVALLKATTFACHTVKDDLESFFHVLAWISLQYTQHGLESDVLSQHLHDVYDDLRISTGKVTGGNKKETSMCAQELAKAGFVPSAFRDLLVDLEETCAARYLHVPDSELVVQDVAGERHKTVRRPVEKQRRAVEEAEKLEAMKGGGSRSGGRSSALLTVVKLSDESKDELEDGDEDGEYTKSLSYFRRHTRIPEEVEVEEKTHSLLTQEFTVLERDENEAQAVTATRTTFSAPAESATVVEPAVNNGRYLPTPVSPGFALSTSPSASTVMASTPTWQATPAAPSSAPTPDPAATERKHNSGPTTMAGLPSPTAASTSTGVTAPFQFGPSQSIRRGDPVHLSSIIGTPTLLVPESEPTSVSISDAAAAATPEPSFKDRPIPESKPTSVSISDVAAAATPEPSFKDKPIPDWSLRDVISWLKSKGFDQDVYGKFAEQEISGDVLTDIDVNILKNEIGVTTFGKRIRVANAIAELKNQMQAQKAIPEPAPKMLAKLNEEQQLFNTLRAAHTQERKDRLRTGHWMIKRCIQALESDNWPSEALARVTHKIYKYDPLKYCDLAPRGLKRASEISTNQLESEGSERSSKRQKSAHEPLKGEGSGHSHRNSKPHKLAK
ncbi:hypothetical protein VKT23_020533 [Stygiomarasmius scandens]|uniref:SAM domain-containing protein n=1 Tax=Marasmiellus scandens TaxID=2682957 RepID=A0ABR1IK22_9AGAR